MVEGTPLEDTLSHNLTLHATARSTIHLKTGDVSRLLEENIVLLQTPTKVTHQILALPSHEERLQAYKNWALSSNTDVVEEIVWDPEDPTIQIELTEDLDQIVTGDSVRVVTQTVGEAHIQQLEETLAGFEGWDFNWSWI